MPNIKLINAIFRGLTTEEKLKEELRLDDKRLYMLLKENKLNHKHALIDLQRQINQAIDFCVSAVDDTDDLYALTVATTKYLNEKVPNITFTEENVRQLLMIQFKSPTERRAYIELCEGELKPYNIYTQNDPTLFIQYLIKSVVVSNAADIFFRNPKKVNRTILFIASKYYPNTEELVKSSLERMGILSAKNSSEVNPRVVKVYKRILTSDTAPYIAGYEKIFAEVLASYRDEIDELNIYRFFEQFSVEGRQAIAKRKLEREQQKQKKEDLQVVETAEINVIVDTPSSEIQQPTENEQQQLIKLKEENAELNMRYKLAYDAIRNLEHELTDAKREVEKVKQDTIEMVFKKLGSAKSNYLLSDLYRIALGKSEMTTKMITNQLMNLFDILNEDFEIEALNNGRKVGDVFTVEREELVSTYQAVNMIPGEERNLTVELVQYGWSLGNKKIVQPLVKIIEQTEVM